MSDADRLRTLLDAASASLEVSKARINDLNVYPVPDGDTGTNMALTVRGTLDGLAGVEEAERAALARAVTRAALMGARGNSGVILSQIVRGAADVLGDDVPVDARLVGQALRAASDMAYRGVKKPVEGTMLTVIREMAEEAEARSAAEPDVAGLLRAVLARGESALARTPDMLSVLKEAGVVDAGGAGLVELMRGIVASVTGEPLPEPAIGVELGIEAIHQELSQYRYCTAFVVEGQELDGVALERELEALGDSLLVVGDELALKVHVHTDDPGAALSLGTARGTILGVEIADMHAQTAERAERLGARVAGVAEARPSGVVAVVAGAGNRELYESVTAVTIVEGGQSMNPSTADILAAIDATPAAEVVVLPNNGNVILSAEQAVGLAAKPVHVVPTRSIQAGLAALFAHDGDLSAAENASAMADAAAGVATAAVTTASRDVELNGLRVSRGQYLGLLEDEPVIGGDSFDEVAQDVVEALLASSHGMLTLFAGADAPALDGLVAAVGERYPEVEVDVQRGGQPHYHLLISAE
jgi:DAK2 domain fusion protein YloV